MSIGPLPEPINPWISRMRQEYAEPAEWAARKIRSRTERVCRYGEWSARWLSQTQIPMPGR
jgi:hypothetical protein